MYAQHVWYTTVLHDGLAGGQRSRFRVHNLHGIKMRRGIAASLEEELFVSDGTRRRIEVYSRFVSLESLGSEESMQEIVTKRLKCRAIRRIMETRTYVFELHS